MTRSSGVAEAGLTLIEMLVVLAIIGVASGATLLSLAPRRSIGVEVEARRLAATVQQAADATMASDGPTAIVVDAAGYRLDGIGAAPRHDLPAGIGLVGAPANPVALALGNGAALDLTIARGSDAWTVSFDGLRAVATRAATSR